MERYADWTDADLVARAKRLNAVVIERSLLLADLVLNERASTVVRVERIASRARETAHEYKAVKYELGRRRVPNPNGATVNVRQINSNVDVGTNSGSVTGTEIGNA